MFSLPVETHVLCVVWYSWMSICLFPFVFVHVYVYVELFFFFILYMYLFADLLTPYTRSILSYTTLFFSIYERLWNWLQIAHSTDQFVTTTSSHNTSILQRQFKTKQINSNRSDVLRSKIFSIFFLHVYFCNWYTWKQIACLGIWLIKVESESENCILVLIHTKDKFRKKKIQL